MKTAFGTVRQIPARPRAASWRAYVQIARPDHWIKNIFVIPGATAALAVAPQASGWETLPLVLALVSVCLVASANYTINEGISLTFTDTATDPDLPANSLSFSLDPGAPPGASVGSTSGVFTWTPTEAQGPGTYPITVRVTDNGSPPLSDTKSFTVIVNEVNSPPSISAVPSTNVNEGDLLMFAVMASDPDLPAQPPDTLPAKPEVITRGHRREPIPILTATRALHSRGS